MHRPLAVRLASFFYRVGGDASQDGGDAGTAAALLQSFARCAPALTAPDVALATALCERAAGSASPGVDAGDEVAMDDAIAAAAAVLERAETASFGATPSVRARRSARLLMERRCLNPHGAEGDGAGSQRQEAERRVGEIDVLLARDGSGRVRDGTQSLRASLEGERWLLRRLVLTPATWEAAEALPDTARNRGNAAVMGLFCVFISLFVV